MRTLTCVTATTVTLLLGVNSVSASTPPVVRLSADDTVGAAISLSRVTFGGGNASAALLARDDVFADSLASGGAQGILHGPLLLTSPDHLDPRVRQELDRLGVRQVFVVGGEAAMSPIVVQELEASGREVARISGSSRIETAVAVAERFFGHRSFPILARAFPSPGAPDTQAFADALAGGAWAASEPSPVLLTETDRLSPATRQYLAKVDADRRSIRVLGGESAVSGAVVSELKSMGFVVERVHGADRFHTAVRIAEASDHQSAMYVDTVILVDGVHTGTWASGLAAASRSAVDRDGAGAVVMLSDGAELPETTKGWLMGADPAELPTLICAPFVHVRACDLAEESLADGTGDRYENAG